MVLSDGDRCTFFGYHDKSPFNEDGSKLLAMSVTASDSDPESECAPMRLGYFCKQVDGVFGQQFIPFAETSTWCWQQGCMLQWHPVHSYTQVFFNALVNDDYGSICFDVTKNRVVLEYHYPIYSLDPAARYAVTLNFSRLGRLRPGYGYALFPDATADEPAPEHDGLFLLDLQSGSRRLLVSLASLAQSAGDAGAQHYVNHATFSPDGKKIVFFHLWSYEGDKGRGLRVCEVAVDTGNWRELESERMVSHYCWRDGQKFLATTREKSGKWHYALYDLIDRTRTDLGLPFNEDSHPMFHPSDHNIIVTDTYPDRRRDQHLCIVNLNKRTSKEIAALYSPVRYRGQVRCDLHSRWDREGRFVAVDTTAYGKRKMLLVLCGD
ncbi:hypothetical protein [Thioalkalivibrio sp. AKL19]|uniref:TolB family protein n=1 Tax=Thioalkalivibrio sp. AKL19 TaxID=1266914 RepID=UPI0012DE7B97|nr:hypothetical protein [Thioalkalivibrio sp. AKL19]